jgi:hypothetical protein
MLTTLLRLVPKLGMKGAILSLPTYSIPSRREEGLYFLLLLLLLLYFKLSYLLQLPCTLKRYQKTLWRLIIYICIFFFQLCTEFL